VRPSGTRVSAPRSLMTIRSLASTGMRSVFAER
jgi:hypothetical protein